MKRTEMGETSSDVTDERPRKKTKREKKEYRKSLAPLNVQIDNEMKASIKDKFLVAMPDDFYDFWQFLYDNNPGDPERVLRAYSLKFAGPYDYILGKSASNSTDYLLHHRFYYDPPEFQTVLKSINAGDKFHIGYYRDAPHEYPSFVATNDEDEGCKLNIVGDNLFAFFYQRIQNDHRNAAKRLRAQMEKIMKNKGYEYGKRTAKIAARERKVVSKGFHGAGIVVPVDDNDVGWREVPMSIGELKKLFAAICKSDGKSNEAADELQEMITYVQFANDECDYGQGLELANDLFCFGHERLHGYIRALMPMAYSLLGYTVFETIILAHLDKRNKSSNVSYLS